MSQTQNGARLHPGLARALARAKTAEQPRPPDPVNFECLASAGHAHNQDLGLLDRLRRRFGRGANPAQRENLYKKLVAIVTEHGERAYELVAQVAAEAVSARKPENYFCYSVLRRLGEAGFYPKKEDFVL